MEKLLISKCNVDELKSLSLEQLSQIFSNDNIHNEWENYGSKIDSLKIPEMAGGVNSGDQRALYYLVRMLKPISILEIGTHIGSSTVALAMAALKNREEGIETKIISTDIIDVNDLNERYWKTIGSPKSPSKIIDSIGCSEIVTFEIGNSIEKMKMNRKFNMIFLDGDHSAKTLYQEIPLALNSLDDGIIILHDYFPKLESLWGSQAPIVGPFLATQRFIEEGTPFNVIPFGELPWLTKFDSKITSLACLVKI
ncbi:MAG: hypothetical protein CBC06_006225 [bacterium TMED46]|nr:MAG: hypothetical protein CBC06_006225 [bacterium TMED46]